jgi:hypothetical protein
MVIPRIFSSGLYSRKASSSDLALGLYLILEMAGKKGPSFCTSDADADDDDEDEDEDDEPAEADFFSRPASAAASAAAAAPRLGGILKGMGLAMQARIPQGKWCHKAGHENDR